MKMGRIRGMVLAAGMAGGLKKTAGAQRLRARLRPTALATLGAISAMACISAAAQDARIAFDITPQPLVSALRAFSSQSARQVLFDEATVAGRNAAAVHGQYSPREALARLLGDSGIQVVVSGSGAFTLKPAPASLAPSSTLPAVTINADADNAANAAVSGYVARQSASGTKSDTPLIRTPQAISVVTREQMDVQNVQSVAQSLRYTSGVNPEQRGANTDSLEYVYARGFLVDQFWNGLRTPGAASGQGYNVTSFDPYMLERVEVLHGPASVLYGQSAPGGIVVLTSKRPTEEPLHEVGFQTGSHGRVQGFFDFSGPLEQDGKLLYRITGDGFSTGTQTDHVREQRVSIAPTLTWRPSRDTSLTVFANYQSDPQAGVYNSVPAAGTVLPGKIAIPRSLDVGDPNFDSFQKTQNSVGYEFFHRFNDTWTIKQNYRYLHNDQTIKYVSATGLSADGLSVLRTPYLNTGSVNSHTLDNQAIASFRTGELAHQATIGLDYQNIQFDHWFYGSGSGSATPSLSIADPQYGVAIPYPTTPFATSNQQTFKQLGVYLQDQVDIGHWSFLLSGRQDWTHEKVVSYVNGSTTQQSDRAFTWRTGAVYQFDNGLAPYLSYARSFQPQVGTDYAGRAFVPQQGTQYEAGVKFQPKGYNSFITVALFDLKQNNVTTTDPLHTGFSVQTGQVNSQGIELEGHASLANNLQLIASYTYTDLRNSKSNTTSLNKVPVGIPSNTASVWTDYTTAAGVQAGAGVRYVGTSYGDSLNTFKVPSATLVDLSLRYDFGRMSSAMKGWTGTLSVNNLFDRAYVASCISSTFCTWGLERTVLANLKYRW